MAIHQMIISSVLYDDVAETLVFKLESSAPLPERPGNVREDLWQVANTSITTRPMPVRRARSSLAQGWYTDPVTRKRYSVTWDGESWSAPVEIA